MPHLPVGFHPAALEESAAAETWYRERSDAAAVAFVAELDRAVERISDAPERWPRHTHGSRAAPPGLLEEPVIWHIGGVRPNNAIQLPVWVVTPLNPSVDRTSTV